MIDRRKFKTELGRKCYDKIMEFNPPHEDYVDFVCMYSNSDEKRKILLDFLENKCQSYEDICDFVDKHFVKSNDVVSISFYNTGT